MILAALVLHGLVDVYYAANPGATTNFLPGTGTTAPKANAFDLNAGAIDASLEGAHLTVAFGSGVDVLQPPAHVVQASLALKLTDALSVEGGIYPSHIGYESFFSKDNWNYTRGWMGEFSPYYQIGAKVSYAFDARWSAQVHLINGWQNDGHAAAGTQLAFNGDRLSASVNTCAGIEQRDEWRLFADLVAVYKLTDEFSLAATADVGHQARANWRAAGAYARYAFSPLVALAARVEAYDDVDGFMSGTAQVLRGVTGTIELRPVDHLILKLEGRTDSPTGSLAIASAVATF